MENITIVSGRETELEFDINIQGANKKEPTVRFVIEDKPINFSFFCKSGKDDNWIVNIPAIPQLKDKAYPFRLEVIIDGYYFEPFRGTVDVVAEPDVKNNTVKHPTEPVVKAASVKKTETKKAKKKVKEKVEIEVETEERIEDIIPEVEDKVITDVKEIENVIEEVEINTEEDIAEEYDGVVGNFKTMAEMWLNRDKEIGSKNENGEIEELSEKAIKVRAILNSIKD